MILYLYFIISQIVIVVLLTLTFAFNTQKQVNTQLNINSESDNRNDNNCNGDTTEIKRERIKRFIYADKTFDASIVSLAENYSFDHTKEPHKRFSNWDTRDNEFISFCNFGIQLLKYSIAHKMSERHLLIVTDILKRIKVKADDSDSNKLIKWKTTGLNNLLQLLVMYEYLAVDNFVSYTICHGLIIEIVPKLNQYLDLPLRSMKVILYAIPRLLTNFLFDSTAYENDIKSDEFKMLSKYFCIEYNLSDEVKTGLYGDGSYIEDDSVVSFVDLLGFVQKRDIFYDKMYSALGFKVNYRQQVNLIFQKLLHPSIKYHIVDLFGNSSNKIKIADSLNLKLLETGVYIFPFTSIGVFKRPNILFAIRLHHSSITSSKKKKTTLGFMQLRKIYHLEDNEEPEGSVHEIVHQLGVIRVKELEMEDTYECIPKESYIGKLLDVDLLFWINKYTLSKPYKCEVNEIGVMTEGGLVSKYQIKNNESDRSLIFVSTDNSGNKEENDIHVGDTGTFSIKISLNPDKIVTNLDFKSDKLMEFEHDKKKYELISLDHKNSYIVKCEDKPIFGGTSSSNPTDYMVYDDQIFKRYSSFMYEPTI